MDLICSTANADSFDIYVFDVTPVVTNVLKLPTASERDGERSKGVDE